MGLLDCIIRLRHQKHGLLLAELGAKLLSPDQAPAGTKRISNLIRSENWQHRVLEEFLFQKALSQLQEWLKAKKSVFALWDDSVVEKHETMQSKDLCAVRSTKAKRLTRIRPGYYQKCCEKTIHVAGLQWSAVLLTTLKDAPCLLSFRWWTTRGKHMTNQGIVLSLDSQQDLLRYGCHRTGKRYKDAFVPLYRTRVALGYLFEVNHLLKLLLLELLTHQNSG